MQTIFIVLGIWLVTIATCVLIAETIRDAAFLIAGSIFLAISATIVVIATNSYYAMAGRALEDREGRIVVECPNGRYSMVGLESSTCPECGESYTIDHLIREQNYAALRHLPSADTGPRTPSRPMTGPRRSPTCHVWRNNGSGPRHRYMPVTRRRRF